MAIDGSESVLGAEGKRGLYARDWIAVQAMQGLTANADWSRQNPEEIAREAYHLADALIKASNKKASDEN